jgi:diaminopimelate decarboxylase
MSGGSLPPHECDVSRFAVLVLAMATSRDGEGFLTLGGVRLVDLARDEGLGTPTYVYDLDAIANEARELERAFEGAPHLIAYAVKANSAGPIVRALARQGCGADVVSGAEMRVALGCGVAPAAIVFSGVAKSDDEIDRAIAARIGAIQVESLEEIDRVDARANAAGTRARIAVRINPGLDKDAIATHAHIATGHDEAKFGIGDGEMSAAIGRALALTGVELVGVASHVGSQLTSVDSYVGAARSVFDAARAARAKGAALVFVDTGGGFGIDYGEGCATRPADFVRAVRAEQRARGLDDLALHIEPGRAMVGAHGVLLSRVIQSKRALPDRAWLMIDAGMNDLIRPALYQARHRIVSLAAPSAKESAVRVVGPVCESSDDFGEHPHLDGAAYVAILDAGAYGYVMASRYNGRALPAEVFLRGGRVVARSDRKSPDDWADERVAIADE